MKTRQECIDQISQVGKNWGIKLPDFSKISDEALRKYCRKLDRDGRKLAEAQE